MKTILAAYDSTTLTAADAKAINEAFRAAGLRQGPGLQAAIRAAGFSPERIGALDPPPNRPNADASGAASPRRDDAAGTSTPTTNAAPGMDRAADRGYSIEQAISDRAQLNTIAFDGLAFLTGDMGCNTFLPPGKVADFCGFQYMRDVDTRGLGHNTSFVPRAANSVLRVLTQAQRDQLVALAKEQEPLLTEFAYTRFPLVAAFSRNLEGQLPTGRQGLSRAAVKQYAARLYEIDGRLSYRRAQVLGGIIRSLSPQQKSQLDALRFDDSSTWPEVTDQVDRKSLSQTVHVAVMTYASEMLSWYAGSIEADVYFCPERHATYFGSFYMKDIPAMGNANYSISTSLTGDSGEAFLAALDTAQRQQVEALVDRQREDLQEIVRVRRDIATQLRRFMREGEVDTVAVQALARRYGELDGDISWMYATTFADVARTLTADQRRTLLALRHLDARFVCRGAYLYSRAIDMPAIGSTDCFFAEADSDVTTGGRRRTAPPTEATAHAEPRAANPSGSAGFVLTSPAVSAGGKLPVEYTGDGAGLTLPLTWSGAPAGTKGYAVIMHHVAPDGETKWYWLLYGIPVHTTDLAAGVQGIGVLGNNSVNGRCEYAPPHSKGPGPKTYVYTVYALSAPAAPPVEATQVTREVLLHAMEGTILASARLEVVYSRPAMAGTAAPAPTR